MNSLPSCFQYGLKFQRSIMFLYSFLQVFALEQLSSLLYPNKDCGIYHRSTAYSATDIEFERRKNVLSGSLDEASNKLSPVASTRFNTPPGHWQTVHNALSKKELFDLVVRVSSWMFGNEIIDGLPAFLLTTDESPYSIESE